MTLSEDVLLKYQGPAEVWTLSRSLDILSMNITNTCQDNVPLCWRLTSTLNEQECRHAVSVTLCKSCILMFIRTNDLQQQQQQSQFPNAPTLSCSHRIPQGTQTFFKTIKYTKITLSLPSDPTVICKGVTGLAHLSVTTMNPYFWYKTGLNHQPQFHSAFTVPKHF